MSERALCPICQSAEHGCSVRDEGVSCYAPTPKAPPSSPSLSPTELGPLLTKWAGVRVGPDVVVTMPVPPSAPSVRCRTCGALVIWISLPAGGRMPVDAVTHEPHHARCPPR